jgi:hypothetical protein
MAKRHDVGGQPHSGAFEKRVTRGSRRILDRAIFPSRELANIGAIDDQRPAEAIGDLDAECLVAVSGVTQLMIEMRQTDDIALA